MKKKKKYLLIILLPLVLFITGCEFLKTDVMEDISVYTTTYPINYIINYLYKDHSTIASIYPTGVNFKEYSLSDKKLNEYSKSDLFIFNSQDQDRNYAVDMINKNDNLLLIDVALGMNYTYSIEELWLNPYNYLMMAKNVKDGLAEYITNPYLVEEINKNYEKLQYELSKLDASYKEEFINSEYNTIVCDNSLFKFLEKYGIDVIVLEEKILSITVKNGDTLSDISKQYNISISDILTYNNKKDENLYQNEIIKIPVKVIDNTDVLKVKKLISDKKIKYIYISEEETNQVVKSLVKDNELELLNINTMYSIDGGITNSNESYLTIMNDNLELFKKEMEK